jgi:hypothetical protein
MSAISTSTGPPAALARSLGAKVATNGTAVAMVAAPPATPVANNQNRRSGLCARGWLERVESKVNLSTSANLTCCVVERSSTTTPPALPNDRHGSDNLA